MIRKWKERFRRWMFALVRMGLLVVVVLAIPVGYVAYDYVQFENRLVLDHDEVKDLTIAEDTSWRAVAAQVELEGIVDSALYFDIWGRRVGLDQQVRAGSYLLEGPLGLEEFADMLRQGGAAEETIVTLREGLTKYHVADRLADAGLVDRERFLEVTRSPERYGWDDEEIEALEGYLFPDTYRFSEDMSETVIADRLVRRWREMTDPLFDEYSDEVAVLKEEYDLDLHDIIIMASLIERETGVDDERPVIARVFYNRLDRGMRLQTDPTCVYGSDTYNQRPTPELCRDEYNRYSTYVIEGLPPGPIANPSVESLRAAMSPSDDEEVQDYLYFVSRRDGTGRHYFSSNYEDHRRAINRYLRGQ